MDTHRLSNIVMLENISIDGLVTVWGNVRQSKGRITQN